MHAFQQFKFNAQLLISYLGLAVIPAMTRSDAGTENGLLATCQMFLRRNCTDGLAGSQSHVYGTSMRNQVDEVLLSELKYTANVSLLAFMNMWQYND